MEKGKTRKGIEIELPSNKWCDLPQIFLSSLLYFLSPKSRCAFKATCRSWNEAELLLPAPAGSPSSPCHSCPTLICTEYHANATYECYHPMSGEFFRLKAAQYHDQLKNATVHCSNFGWLLLSERRDRPSFPGRFFFFFNPFTKRKIDRGCRASSPAMCFTSPPTSSDRPVISGMSLSEVLRNQHLSPHYSLVFHRGLFYCLVGAGVVGVSQAFKTLDTGANYTFHDTKLFECGTKLRNSFLLEVDGKLLGIFDYQGVRVLWLDIKRWEWNPVGDEDLRDTILYVSYEGSFVQCDATTKGLGNKIYIPAIINGGGVYYSLDTRKYHTASCELEDIGLDIDLDHRNSMTWITPTTDLF